MVSLLRIRVGTSSNPLSPHSHSEARYGEYDHHPSLRDRCFRHSLEEFLLRLRGFFGSLVERAGATVRLHAIHRALQPFYKLLDYIFPPALLAAVQGGRSPTSGALPILMLQQYLLYYYELASGTCCNEGAAYRSSEKDRPSPRIKLSTADVHLLATALARIAPAIVLFTCSTPPSTMLYMGHFTNSICFTEHAARLTSMIHAQFCLTMSEGDVRVALFEYQSESTYFHEGDHGSLLPSRKTPLVLVDAHNQRTSEDDAFDAELNRCRDLHETPQATKGRYASSSRHSSLSMNSCTPFGFAMNSVRVPVRAPQHEFRETSAPRRGSQDLRRSWPLSNCEDINPDDTLCVSTSARRCHKIAPAGAPECCVFIDHSID